MQEMVQDIREQVETKIKKEKDEDSQRNEEDRMKRKKEGDKEWRERKSRRDQTKILKPVPKAVLMMQAPKNKKRLRLRIQVGIDTIEDIGVDGETDIIEDLKQKFEERCKFAIATIYVKITGQWARLFPFDVIKNVIRAYDNLMAVPCESCYRIQTYFVQGLVLEL